MVDSETVKARRIRLWIVGVLMAAALAALAREMYVNPAETPFEPLAPQEQNLQAAPRHFSNPGA